MAASGSSVDSVIRFSRDGQGRADEHLWKKWLYLSYGSPTLEVWLYRVEPRSSIGVIG
jgi:hypothetical protein